VCHRIPRRVGLVDSAKRSKGFAHHLRPTYAGANVGHPSDSLQIPLVVSRRGVGRAIIRRDDLRYYSWSRNLARRVKPRDLIRVHFFADLQHEMSGCLFEICSRLGDTIDLGKEDGFIERLSVTEGFHL
jgi:hypothetical protein